jgi:hypothetical protein
VTIIGETYFHNTSNSRFCPLQSCEDVKDVNPVMQGVAQPVTSLHYKTDI